MPRHIYLSPIATIRPSKHKFATYSKFVIPEIDSIHSRCTGDFSWTNLDLKLGKTSWETFKKNPALWTCFESPTSCYVDISSDTGTKNISFYRDQQDCIIWSINPNTGHIYSTIDGPDPVEYDIEHFWLRLWIESALWFHYSWHENTNKPTHKILSKYADYYLVPRLSQHTFIRCKGNIDASFPDVSDYYDAVKEIKKIIEHYTKYDFKRINAYCWQGLIPDSDQQVSIEIIEQNIKK